MRGPDGKARPAHTLNSVIDPLQRQGRLDTTQACAPALQHALAVDALESADAARRMVSGG